MKYLPYPEYPREIPQTGDHSILRLIPPAELQVSDKDLFPAETLVIKPFYMSETPVPNQQYINFLNSVIDRVQVKVSDVYLNDRLVLKLSEKIRAAISNLFLGACSKKNRLLPKNSPQRIA